MAMGRAVALGLVVLGMFARPADAGDLFTCQTLGSFNSCAGATFWVEENPELGSTFNVSLTHWSSDLPLRVTAIGFYSRAPGKPLANLSIAPSFWSDPAPATWAKNKNRHIAEPRLGGFTLFASSSVPTPAGYDFALGGPLFSGEVFQFDIEGGMPAQVLWVWRAQSADGSLVVDCFQGPSGRTQCLSGSLSPLVALALFGTERGASFPSSFVLSDAALECLEGECLSAVPEPSTLLMVATGLLALGAGARARRRGRGRPAQP